MMDGEVMDANLNEAKQNVLATNTNEYIIEIRFDFISPINLELIKLTGVPFCSKTKRRTLRFAFSKTISGCNYFAVPLSTLLKPLTVSPLSTAANTCCTVLLPSFTKA